MGGKKKQERWVDETRKQSGKLPAGSPCPEDENLTMSDLTRVDALSAFTLRA